MEYFLLDTFDDVGRAMAKLERYHEDIERHHDFTRLLDDEDLLNNLAFSTAYAAMMGVYPAKSAYSRLLYSTAHRVDYQHLPTPTECVAFMQRDTGLGAIGVDIDSASFVRLVQIRIEEFKKEGPIRVRTELYRKYMNRLKPAEEENAVDLAAFVNAPDLLIAYENLFRRCTAQSPLSFYTDPARVQHRQEVLGDRRNPVTGMRSTRPIEHASPKRLTCAEALREVLTRDAHYLHSKILGRTVIASSCPVGDDPETDARIATLTAGLQASGHTVSWIRHPSSELKDILANSPHLAAGFVVCGLDGPFSLPSLCKDAGRSVMYDVSRDPRSLSMYLGDLFGNLQTLRKQSNSPRVSGNLAEALCQDLIARRVRKVFQNDTSYAKAQGIFYESLWKKKLFRVLAKGPVIRNTTRDSRGKNEETFGVFAVDTRKNPWTAAAVVLALSTVEDPGAWSGLIYTAEPAYYRELLGPEWTDKYIAVETPPEMAPVLNASFDRDAYNAMMKSADFWERLQAKFSVVVAVQDDGFVFKSGIEKFTEDLDYDYIGAPWADVPDNAELVTLANPQLVGNGGLSVRRPAAMRRACESNIEANSESSLLFFGNTQPTPEDVFFAGNPTVRVASRQRASEFASEQVLSPSSIGSHRIWAYHSPADVAAFCDQCMAASS